MVSVDKRGEARRKRRKERVKAYQANTRILKTCGNLLASSRLCDHYTGHISSLDLSLIEPNS
jgi:hypothetical protein